MKLIDIAPVEKWVQLEKSVHEASGLTVGVFDTDGARITDHVNWANRLCPVIKGTDKGKTYICSLAHRHICENALRSARMVVDACDAGLAKIVAPVLFDGGCIGFVSGCGKLPEAGELESFLINAVTGIAPEEIDRLALGLGILSHEKASAAGVLMQQKINALIADSGITEYENSADRR